tara:strand:+ start:154 stop:849 length:696 start_codon:yes stop_codon:yes gene_type:complete
MKKIFFLLIISSFAFNTNAQNLSVPHYGIKVGLNHSSFNYTQYNYLFLGLVKPDDGLGLPKTTYNNGVKAGAFIDLKLSKRWYISPTVSYSQFGVISEKKRTWNVDTIRTTGNEVKTYTMDYVTLDANFEYRVTDRFSLSVGPSGGYLISNNVVKVVNEEGYQRIEDDFNGEIEGVNTMDAGLNLGLSFFITEHLDVDLNLYLGMLEFENIDEGYQKSLQAGSLSFGYTFN